MRRSAKPPAACRRPPPWRRILAAREGASAVELAVALPILLLILMGIIQFGGLFYLQHSMVLVASDLTRGLAVGAITSAAAIEEAETRLAGWNATFTVTVDEPGPDEIGLTIRVPIQDAALITFGDVLGEGDLTAETVMRKEF